MKLRHHVLDALYAHQRLYRDQTFQLDPVTRDEILKLIESEGTPPDHVRAERAALRLLADAIVNEVVALDDHLVRIRTLSREIKGER
jgi:Ser/Thr protein kinase RdoA (MazF antagonist)